MDRNGMLQRELESWNGFLQAIDATPPDRRTVEGVVPGWSTHDLVWHCAYWTGWAGDVLERAIRGEPEPKEPEDEAAWDAEILAEGRAMGWDEAIRRAEENRVRARTAFAAFDEPPELAVQWFTDDTFDHYEEHAEQIRAFNDGA
jgi:hypothetical protein